MPQSKAQNCRKNGKNGEQFSGFIMIATATVLHLAPFGRKIFPKDLAMGYICFVDNCNYQYTTTTIAKATDRDTSNNAQSPKFTAT